MMKLDSLFAYCLHHSGILAASRSRMTLAESHALNKEPSGLDKLIAFILCTNTEIELSLARNQLLKTIEVLVTENAIY